VEPTGAGENPTLKGTILFDIHDLPEPVKGMHNNIRHLRRLRRDVATAFQNMLAAGSSTAFDFERTLALYEYALEASKSIKYADNYTAFLVWTVRGFDNRYPDWTDALHSQTASNRGKK
jgi:hypothetical protein